MADIIKILNNMTLSEKIGQLAQYNAAVICPGGGTITGPEDKLLGLRDEDLYKVGSVLNFKDLNEMMALQKKHIDEDRNGIPLLFMMDVIHGYRTIYPIPLALGASFDSELVKECSKMASREAAANGIHVTFTPMVDYVRDGRWGRVMETCGEEPMLNSIMGAAQVEAFQGNDLSDPDSLAACVKHFAAYGGAEGGRDYNTVELSEHVLREYYFPAYKACIDAGVKLLMPSFNTLNGVPSIGNKWLMNEVLRKEWGFNGVVISDYNAVNEQISHGTAEDMKDAAKKAFECGCDIEMCSSTYYHNLEALVNEGVFTEEQIDEAVLKVLSLKNELGLFEDPNHGASPERAAEVTLTKENRALARRAAIDCAVLLKNDGILPLSEKIKKIALIGPFANSKHILGAWSCNGINDESVTVYEGLKAALPNAEITVAKGCSCVINDTDRSGFDEAIKAASEADAVILCIGEEQHCSGEGNSRADVSIPGVQSELAAAVTAANPNTVAVLFNGRPLVLTELRRTVPAILEMFFPGTEGGNAVADLLLGRANPSGKLTMSFPKHVGQYPLYYNALHTGRPRPKETEDDVVRYCSSYIDCGNLALYPFGYGLSYSNFVYESLTLDKNEMTKNETLTVTIKIKNDSNHDGKETVQLYMHDICASTARPDQQLIAFEKVLIKAGETVTVTFTVNEEMLRFYNIEHKHVSEPGVFELSTGCADNLILTKSFILK